MTDTTPPVVEGTPGAGDPVIPPPVAPTPPAPDPSPAPAAPIGPGSTVTVSLGGKDVDVVVLVAGAEYLVTEFGADIEEGETLSADGVDYIVESIGTRVARWTGDPEALLVRVKPA